MTETQTETFPQPLTCMVCECIESCLNQPQTNQDCQNCSNNPQQPCQLCSPCCCPFAIIFDIITFPCRVSYYEYNKCCTIIDKV